MQNQLSDFCISMQHVNRFDDEIVVDVKGEYHHLELMTLNGCALGSASGAQLRVKLLKPPYIWHLRRWLPQ